MRKLIARPEYQNGKLLPKEVELAKILGISRNTIRQATNKLGNENLLVRKKGVGTRAVNNTVTTRLTNWLSFSSEMPDKGMEFVNYDFGDNFGFFTNEIKDYRNSVEEADPGASIYINFDTQIFLKIKELFEYHDCINNKPRRG